MDIITINSKLSAINQLVNEVRVLVNGVPTPVPEPVEPPTPAPASGKYVISRSVGLSTLTITATDRCAGAIESVTWQGKEFINNLDHGRELQSASTFDHKGEAFNPTEAGSNMDYDGVGPTSSSKLLEISASGNVLKTKTQMAFWIPVNGVPLSNHILSKTVTIGHPASDHIIEYVVNFKVAEAHGYGQIEAVTGYMPSEFNTLWGFNPLTGKLESLAGDGEQSLPVIISTPDGSYAMGVYSSDHSNVKSTLGGYGAFSSSLLLQPVTKWNCVFRRESTPAGDYSFKCYVIVGSLENVRVSMIQLRRYLKENPIPNPDPVPDPQIPSIFPPTAPGLSLVLDLKNSKRCLFTGVRYKSGLLLGDYGLNQGGAKIQYYDGAKLVDEAKFSSPLAESAFHIILADDGVPIASCEKWGMMQRRQPDSKWERTFGGGQGDIPTVENDLSFGIFRVGATLYCFIHTFGESLGDGFMVKSTDNGRSWTRDGDYGNMLLYCGNSDGSRILLAGKRNDHPWIIDKGKSTVAERTDLQGKRYSQLCGKDGKWTFAGDNFIDYWDGGTPRTVWQSDRPYAMWTEIDKVTGYRIALFSVWNESGYNDAQAVISKDDGKSWKELCDVPCPCLLGTCFADGGVYLFGGKYQEYGRVYFYKF